MKLFYKYKRNYDDLVKIAEEDEEYNISEYLNLGCGYKLKIKGGK